MDLSNFNIVNKMFSRALGVLCLLFVFKSNSAGKKLNVEKFYGQVISCHDGDTCKVQVAGSIIKVRFSGIDAPEISQAEGKIAKQFLDSLILKKSVNLECNGQSFNRKTCTVFLKQKNINEEMVKAGMAFDCPKYSKGKYRELMKIAQQNKLGIWKSINRSPTCYRHPKLKKCIVDKMSQ